MKARELFLVEQCVEDYQGYHVDYLEAVTPEWKKFSDDFCKSKGMPQNTFIHVIEASALEAKDAEIAKLEHALNEVLSLRGMLCEDYFLATQQIAEVCIEALAKEPVGT